jgi:hypothetical protein
MLPLDFTTFMAAEAAIHSTRAAVHAAYRRQSAALRQGDSRTAARACLDAREALREHNAAMSGWLDAARA